MGASKSYWMNVIVEGPRNQEAILSWLGPLCEGMSVESADILCDKKTDREKKIRIFLRDPEGKRKMATRTLGKSTFTITLENIGEERENAR